MGRRVGEPGGQRTGRPHGWRAGEPEKTEASKGERFPRAGGPERLEDQTQKKCWPRRVVEARRQGAATHQKGGPERVAFRILQGEKLRKNTYIYIYPVQPLSSTEPV